MWSRFIIIGLFLALQFLNGCSKDAAPCTKKVSDTFLNAINQTQLQKDVQTIDNYLAANSIVAQQDGGLRYVISNSGDGTKYPCLEGQILVTYMGKLMSNGTIFDQATDPVAFKLSDLIIGWQVGFLKLTPGATATLYVPSGYGYGAKAQTKIPANSNLIFEVTLLDIANPEN